MDTGGHTRGADDREISLWAVIPNPHRDDFATTRVIRSSDAVEKNLSIGGQAASRSAMGPAGSVRIDILDSDKKRLKTVYTNKAGRYRWSHKYTGDTSTFYVKVTAPGYRKTRAVTLKSNAFVVVNFLDMP